MAPEGRAEQFVEVRDAVRKFETARDWKERERILATVKSSLLSLVRVFVGVARSLGERAAIQRALNPTQAMIDVSPTVWFMLKRLHAKAASSKERDELRQLLDELDSMRRPAMVQGEKTLDEAADGIVG